MKANTNVYESEAVKAATSKYNKTPAQVVLNWNLQRNCVIVPKSGDLDRQKENLGALDFALTKEEVDEISNLDRHAKVFYKDGFAL